MSAIPGFLEALLARPEDGDTRGVFADYLDDHDLWTWEAVRHLLCEHPHITGLRLLAADWLDRHEQQWRADFIRLQCRIWKRRAGPAGQVSLTSPWLYNDREFQALQKAEAEFISGNLWRILRDELPEMLARDLDRWRVRGDMIQSVDGDVRLSFARGFVDAISCPLHQWYYCGPALVALQPIECVSILSHVPVESIYGTVRIVIEGGPADMVSPCVPRKIARFLDRAPYHNEYATLEDLNAACLSWARAETGLRPAAIVTTRTLDSRK